MTNLIGPDISFYQDASSTVKQIDFQVMKDAPVDFVIIRAGQNAWVDSDFEYNWREAGKVGIPRGSYFFYDSRVSPEAQINTWLKALGGAVPECGHWADFEEAYNGAHGKEAHFREFVERAEDVFSAEVEIGIYTRAEWWKRRVKDYAYWRKFPLWIANYETTIPDIPPPWSVNEWTFWQWTAEGDGKKYGVESKEIDLNYFNGDETKFAEMFGLSVPPPPTPLRTMIVSVIDSEGRVYSGEVVEEPE